jgi:hypothetical protein
MGAIHQYARQENYNDIYDGDTNEEMEMEAPPAVVALALAPELIIVPDEKRKKTWRR